MANPTCSTANFQTQGACLKNFSREERKALLIYFNVLELAAIGGTNYTAQLGHAGTLATDSECFRLVNNPTQAPSIPYLVIAQAAATNAGGNPATTPTALATAILCLVDFTPAQKAAMMLYLACSLGSHKSYPQ